MPSLACYRSDLTTQNGAKYISDWHFAGLIPYRTRSISDSQIEVTYPESDCGCQLTRAGIHIIS
jgi:hypothetical protein